MVTWGCLRNYVLVFTKKREGFCGMKNRISSIYYLPHSFLHLFIRLFYMLFQKQKEDSTLILNHISKAPYFRRDRGVIEENVLYHCLWRLNINSYNLRSDRVIEDVQKTSYVDYGLGKFWCGCPESGRSKPNFEGRPGYDPRDLLRGYVYGSFYDFFCYLCLVFNSVDFTLLLFTKTMSLTKTFDYH